MQGEEGGAHLEKTFCFARYVRFSHHCVSLFACLSFET